MVRVAVILLRLALTLVFAALGAMVSASASGAAALAPTMRAAIYGYDNAAHPSAAVATPSERGPPVAYDIGTDHDISECRLAHPTRGCSWV